MACICNDPNGRKRIQFVDADGQRRAIRLPKCSKSDAEKIRTRVEHFLTAKILGSGIDRDDAIWLAGDGAVLRTKLEKVGLLPPLEAKPDKPPTLLSAFLTDYLTRHSAGKKPGTLAVWRQVIANLNSILPADIHLHEVTVGHAKEFHESIKSRMAASTVDKRIRFCRQFFTDAVDWELIPANPFSKVKTTDGGPKSNVHVSADMLESQVMPVCDQTWKTILALSRFGGLRTPSETLSLRWVDIDWERGRMAITEPKVEHHVGRGVRSCPIFAELRPYLEEAWDAARDGAEFVIDNADYRRAANSSQGWKNANLRTQFARILKRAGVPTWKRLFHSMRASRQTELERQFPLHVVCSWLGNSERIARKSYLLVTDADFEKAAHNPAQLSPKTAHNPAQHRARTESPGARENQGNQGENAGFSAFSLENQRRGQDSNSSDANCHNELSRQDLANRPEVELNGVAHNCAQLALSIAGQRTAGAAESMLLSATEAPTILEAIKLLRSMTSAEQQRELQRWQSLYG